MSQCDELRPICTNCSKRHAECEYGSDLPLRWMNAPGSTAQDSSSSGPEGGQETNIPLLITDNTLALLHSRGSEEAAPLETPALPLTELELMIQWSNETYQVLSRNERTDHIWRSLVPQEALTQPFLMHGILALSALHLGREKDESDSRRAAYIRLAVAHQNQALALFRNLLHDINPSNVKAMFAFASIVAVYSFGFPHTPPAEDPWRDVDDLYQILIPVRGVQEVINTASSFLRDSDFRPLMQMDDHPPALTDDERDAFERLRQANIALAARDPTHVVDVFARAIGKVEKILGTVSVGSTSVGTAGRLAIELPRAYVECVRDHHPLAMVLLAFYCAILHRLRRNWCLDGWGARVARAVWCVLDESCGPVASWA